MGNQLAQRSVLFQVIVGKKKKLLCFGKAETLLFSVFSRQVHELSGRISASWFAKLAYVKKSIVPKFYCFSEGGNA